MDPSHCPTIRRDRPKYDLRFGVDRVQLFFFFATWKESQP
jgi:hypothetical protein